VVRNPGLDVDMTGWVQDGTRDWAAEDAEGCPFSGSLSLGAADGYIFQCVPVSASTTYNFGAMIKVAPSGAFGSCHAYFFSSIDCSRPSLPSPNEITFDVASGQWTQIQASVQSPASALTAEISCSGREFKIDQMYLSKAPGMY
jgi:hypothetical protein